MKKSLSKSIEFTVKGNKYPISQPTIGQIIEIEMIKAQITNGNYGKMVSNYNTLSVLSLDMVDMFSQFKVLCPKLLEELRVESWIDLDGFDAIDLFKAYQTQLKPWLAQFTQQLTEVWSSVTDSLSEDEVDEKKAVDGGESNAV